MRKRVLSNTERLKKTKGGKKVIVATPHGLHLRRFTEILCLDVGLGSLRRLRSRCRIFCNTKYCCKAAPNQDAKFARKSLSMNRASLPLATPQLRFCVDFMHKKALISPCYQKK